MAAVREHTSLAAVLRASTPPRQSPARAGAPNVRLRYNGLSAQGPRISGPFKSDGGPGGGGGLKPPLRGGPTSPDASGQPSQGRQHRRSDPALQTALETAERLSQQMSAVLEDNEELCREVEQGRAGTPETAIQEEAVRSGVGLGGDIYFTKGAAS